MGRTHTMPLVPLLPTFDILTFATRERLSPGRHAITRKEWQFCLWGVTFDPAHSPSGGGLQVPGNRHFLGTLISQHSHSLDLSSGAVGHLAAGETHSSPSAGTGIPLHGPGL